MVLRTGQLRKQPKTMTLGKQLGFYVPKFQVPKSSRRKVKKDAAVECFVAGSNFEVFILESSSESQG